MPDWMQRAAEDAGLHGLAGLEVDVQGTVQRAHGVLADWVSPGTPLAAVLAQGAARADAGPVIRAVQASGRPVHGELWSVSRTTEAASGDSRDDRHWLTGDLSATPDGRLWLTGWCQRAPGVSERAGEGRDAAPDRPAAEDERLRELGRLVGGVAHDFNNLLSALGVITDFVQTDVRHGRVPDAADVAELEGTVDRARRLVRQLLTIGRPGEEGAEPPEALDLAAMVDDMASLLRRLVGPAVAVRVLGTPRAGDAGAGEAPLRPRVRLRAVEFEQVLLNLVVNARDAMPQGGRLEVAVREAADAVTVRVSDTGCGMSAPVIERMFERYFTTKGPGHGTGIGLATVHAVVTGAGGHLRVESTVGRGTTFELVFPVVSPPCPGECGRAGPEAAPHDLAGRQVLVITAHPTRPGVWAPALAALGLVVRTVPTLDAVSGVIQAHGPPDIMVVDAELPVRDELERYPVVVRLRGDDHAAVTGVVEAWGRWGGRAHSRGSPQGSTTPTARLSP